MQCTNWDGGEQERDTVIDCIKAVFPNAPIATHKKNKYPLRVKIEAKIATAADVGGASSKVKVWDGDQKQLFRKNVDQRAKCMDEICTRLEMLREDIV